MAQRTTSVDINRLAARSPSLLAVACLVGLPVVLSALAGWYTLAAASFLVGVVCIAGLERRHSRARRRRYQRWQATRPYQLRGGWRSLVHQASVAPQCWQRATLAIRAKRCTTPQKLRFRRALERLRADLNRVAQQSGVSAEKVLPWDFAGPYSLVLRGETNGAGVWLLYQFLSDTLDSLCTGIEGAEIYVAAQSNPQERRTSGWFDDDLIEGFGDVFGDSIDQSD